MTVETVVIADLVHSERLRCRVHPIEMQAAALSGIRETMEESGPAWGDVDPILVGRLTKKMVKADGWATGRAEDGVLKAGALVLIGGYTRIYWATTLGIEEAPATIRDLTWSEAVELAWKENSRHGAGRTDRDVKLILDAAHGVPAYRDLSARELAKVVATSRSTINRYRKDLKDAASPKNESKGEDNNPKTLTPTPEPPKAPAGQQLSFNDTPEGREYRDMWGRAVPDLLRDRFRIVDTARAKADKLRKLANELRVMKYGSEDSTTSIEPGLARVDILEIAPELYAHADSIEANLPFLVCPRCDGDGAEVGCDQCKGLGYLLRSAADTLPADLERKARNERKAA